MNLQGLKAYVLIMRQGTLASAAETMHLSGPAVSRHLAMFENELNIKLFTREKRQLTPTAYGRAFLLEAERILHTLEDAPRIIKTIKAGFSQTLRVVTVPRLAKCIAAPAAVRFARQAPDISLILDVQPFRYYESWVAAMHFDLGLGTLPVLNDTVYSEPLYEFPGVVVLPKGHNLASRPYLELAELVEVPMVAPVTGTRIRHQIETLLSDLKIAPAIRVETANADMSCTIVANGYGFTIADPMSASAVGISKLEVVPLLPRISMECGFIYPRSPKPLPLLEQFTKIVKSVTDDYLKRYRKLWSGLDDFI